MSLGRSQPRSLKVEQKLSLDALEQDLILFSPGSLSPSKGVFAPPPYLLLTSILILVLLLDSSAIATALVIVVFISSDTTPGFAFIVGFLSCGREFLTQTTNEVEVLGVGLLDPGDVLLPPLVQRAGEGTCGNLAMLVTGSAISTWNSLCRRANWA